jgi:hypothetical protein
MNARRSLLAALLALLAAPAAAQQQPRRPAQPQARRPVRRRPAGPAPQPQVAAPARGEPAPVPNRDLEAPRQPGTQPSARVDPTLIDPAEPRPGTATDRNSPQAREDRLLRQPAPGARLRVPFAF